MFEAILKEVKAFDTIILHRHSRPDGDAMGSQIGMKHLLLENFPEKKVYMVGDDAGYLGFMEDSAMDEITDKTYDGALAMVLDCGSAHLISDGRWQKAARTVRFDHHIFSGKFTDVEAVDSSYESCCGLVAQFAMDCGLRLNRLAAKSLYTGMLTDSGRFRYDSTTARTFRLASFLMEQRIDTNEIFRHLYAETFESKKMKAEFLLKIRFTPNRVAYIYTTKEEVAAMHVSTFTVSRGMVNTMADIKGTDIWVNFTETDEGVLCELRSAVPNINPIAVKYGGGGHAKASGATVADREAAMQMLHDLDNLAGEYQ
ncbi:MAG: bifunctional oligoribonuclease/PAP phosphatase NrnA [Oscillospiraceae bacterium]|nr:bifunctional oligoribonuclease/PAP phosphatase NrnA [Oscillospiraceae bacterium]